jgi:hypothetical protein
VCRPIGSRVLAGYAAEARLSVAAARDEGQGQVGGSAGSGLVLGCRGLKATGAAGLVLHLLGVRGLVGRELRQRKPQLRRSLGPGELRVLAEAQHRRGKSPAGLPGQSQRLREQSLARLARRVRLLVSAFNWRSAPRVDAQGDDDEGRASRGARRAKARGYALGIYA